MITHEDAERAVDWLRDNADAIGASKANVIYMEEWRKSLRAQIMAEHKDLALGAQERQALLDHRMQEQLKALQAAVHESTRLNFLAKAAEAKLELYRTQQANLRVGA